MSVQYPVRTPKGPLYLTASEHGLTRASWLDLGLPYVTGDVPGLPHLLQGAKELTEYFVGKRTEFTVPLDLRGTPFQLAVWKAVFAIPYGEVRTYLDIARAVGSPNASRAVGGANGRNNIPIIIPCHRVIASGGQLGGYTGGLHYKRALLAIEGATHLYRE